MLKNNTLEERIVSKLIEATFLDEKSRSFAVEIAEEEIIVRKAAGDFFPNHRNPISSESLAALIVDAMLYGKIIAEDNFDKAIEAAKSEIEASKVSGTYA